MKRRVIIDGRNALDPEALMAAGFEYVGFGRAGEIQALAARAAEAASGEAATVEIEPSRAGRQGQTAVTTGRASRASDHQVAVESIQAKPSGA